MTVNPQDLVAYATPGLPNKARQDGAGVVETLYWQNVAGALVQTTSPLIKSMNSAAKVSAS